jgi:hypothetical protein
MREQSLSLADPDSFAAGWPPLERSASERRRQFGESGRELLVRLDLPQEVEVAVTARTDREANGKADLTCT